MTKLGELRWYLEMKWLDVKAFFIDLEVLIRSDIPTAGILLVSGGILGSILTSLINLI